MKINTFIFLTLCFLVSCYTTKKAVYKAFNIKKAQYQTQIKNENQRSTTIKIEILDADKSVHFDSLVFEKTRMPLTAEYSGGSIVLTCIFEFGIPLLGSTAIADTRTDGIIYTQNGKKDFIEIRKWKRIEMKYR